MAGSAAIGYSTTPQIGAYTLPIVATGGLQKKQTQPATTPAPMPSTAVPNPAMSIQPMMPAQPQAQPLQQLMQRRQQVTGPMLSPQPEMNPQYNMLLDYLYGNAGMSNPMGEISPMRRVGAQMLGLF